MIVNVTKMQEQQAKRLETINKQPVEYDTSNNDEGSIVDYSNTEYDISHTNMLLVNDVLTLTRIIAAYVYRVEFSCDTKCCDIVSWFEVNDKIFMQCSRRTKKNA